MRNRGQAITEAQRERARALIARADAKLAQERAALKPDTDRAAFFKWRDPIVHNPKTVLPKREEVGA